MPDKGGKDGKKKGGILSKIVVALVVGFVLYCLIIIPAESAKAAKSIANGVESVVDSITTFVGRLDENWNSSKRS